MAWTMKVGALLGALAAADAKAVHRRGLLRGLHTDAEESQWGNNRCPCVGLNGANITLHVQIGGRKVDYPGDLGSVCEAWDGKYSPQRQGDEKDADCEQPWCFVDPLNCNIEEKQEAPTEALTEAEPKEAPMEEVRVVDEEKAEVTEDEQEVKELEGGSASGVTPFGKDDFDHKEWKAA
mmetsp:Transcript_95244/g.308461  ORF Transcript_95244/g.308461 Transcript_95244/m.308461 type:complete len:179 (+) Transcript_95244:86-622(+)